MDKFNVGDKVRYIGNDHKKMPEFYPEIGTAGIVINSLKDSFDVYIQWKKGSTSKKDCWYCDKDDIELIIEDITNEEIWDFLKNKMSKNGLVPKISIIKTHVDDYPNNGIEIIKAYHESDVVNAIAIAYRSGYERAMKGRPFKIGGKPKK